MRCANQQRSAGASICIRPDKGPLTDRRQRRDMKRIAERRVKSELNSGMPHGWPSVGFGILGSGLNRHLEVLKRGQATECCSSRDFYDHQRRAMIFVMIAISGSGRFTETYKTYQVAFSLQMILAVCGRGDDVRIGGLKVGSVKRYPDSAGSFVRWRRHVEIPSLKFTIAKDTSIIRARGIDGIGGD